VCDLVAFTSRYRIRHEMSLEREGPGGALGADYLGMLAGAAPRRGTQEKSSRAPAILSRIGKRHICGY